MRIAMFTRYSRMGASSRYRLLQYIPAFESAGHTVEVFPLMGDEYLERLYRSGSRSMGDVAGAYLKRLAELRGLRGYDAVMLEQEFLPYVPGWVETFFFRGARRLVVDYDDAAYVKYEGNPFLRGKIASIMAAADAVVAGNNHLREYALRWSKNVHMLPSVVDVRSYPVRAERGDSRVKVAWIGTPNTAKAYLEPLFPELRKAQQSCRSIQYIFVGAGKNLELGDLDAEIVDWSEETEGPLLASCDAGIMPLTDDRFARGKCGLKLVQYMAAGLPVIASAVGANCDIVVDGSTGLLVNQDDEWEAALVKLCTQAELRQEMGRLGRERAMQKYDIQACAEEWLTILANPH